nr:6-bladed beta-propeller [uncultured Carboxylicivirga sp.]
MINNENNSINTIHINMDKVKEYTTNDLFDSCSAIQLETNDSSLIGQADMIQVYKELLFILDRGQRKILWFNKSGDFVSCLDKIGKGADEYLDICDFYINENNGNIETTDARTYRVYSLNKQLVMRKNIQRETGLFLHNISRIDSDKISCISSIKNSIGYIYSLTNNRILKKQELYPEVHTEYEYLSGIGSFKNGSQSSYLYSNIGCSYISTVDNDGFTPAYSFDFGEDQIDWNDPSFLSKISKLKKAVDIVSFMKELMTTKIYFFWI